MAYIANQQRETYEERLVRGNTPTTVATFQINKPNTGGGENPYSLLKVQANWYSGSLLVNSELYVNQVIITPITSSPAPYYLPGGETGNDDGNFPISAPFSTNAVKYSHLLFSDFAGIYDYFKISFLNLRDDPDDPGSPYYLIDVVVNTPDYNDGDLMTDSYCYILNTI
jgi:hypothetical protein